MSHTKVREPKAQENPGPKLSLDPDILISEFKNLDAQLAAINATIQKAVEAIQNKQEVIKSVKAEGQVILGKMDMLARILNGMGIDPRTLVAQAEIPAEEFGEKEPIFSEEKPPKKDQVAENKEDARVTAIKQRFRK
jgi:hypothetical protein